VTCLLRFPAVEGGIQREKGMKELRHRFLSTVLVTLASGMALAVAGEMHLSALSGGDFTVPDESALAYSLPVPGLDAEQLELFTGGRQEFHQRWVVLAVIGGKWGRGPTSNGEICTDCHVGNGRGHVPESERETLASMVVRLSVPGESGHGGPLPHPNYGDQLQNQGELGRVFPEGDAVIAWSEREERLPDGSKVSLRTPKLQFTNLAFGPLGADTMTSVRNAPPVFGAGLLDAIAEDAVFDIARRQQELGFSGRPNTVWDAEKQTTALGRFGWKANQPSLRQQNASAFLNDMGVTTSVFKRENCPEKQVACRKRPLGMVPEQPDRAFNELLFYTRALGVPARRHVDDPVVQRGERLFVEAQCAVCHVPEIKTGEYPALPRLGHQLIHPYTDLLLHDMGEGLADGRPDFRAGPRDWRTSPLWGIGLSGKVNGNASFLHDGRARDLTEAILWHGGEAEGSREAFRGMPKTERDALLVFLNSL
jgi:CxxC motif-containing protein (DUF1111 family)